MMNQTADSGRHNTYLAAVIIVAAILISASIFFATSTFTTTVTKTSTQTTTETTTQTTTETTIETTTLLVSSTNIATGTATSSTGVRVYAVTFQQVRDCGQYNIMPWAVALNGLTQVEPSNQTLPLPTNGFSTIVPNQNLTRITLFVPPGTYSYTVSGGAAFGGGLYPSSGTVVVSGSDVVVNLGVWLSFTCTSSTTTQA